MSFKYRGFWGRNAKRHCPHSNLAGIFGDQIIHAGMWRLWCKDCGRYIDGPVKLARLRMNEKNS